MFKYYKKHKIIEKVKKLILIKKGWNINIYIVKDKTYNKTFNQLIQTFGSPDSWQGEVFNLNTRVFNWKQQQIWK